MLQDLESVGFVSRLALWDSDDGSLTGIWLKCLKTWFKFLLGWLHLVLFIMGEVDRFIWARNDVDC